MAVDLECALAIPFAPLTVDIERGRLRFFAHSIGQTDPVYVANGINAELVIMAVRTGEHRRRGLNLLVGERGTDGFSRPRNAFGASLGASQTTRFRLAELVTEVEITQHYVDRCVHELMAGRLSPVDAAKAKLWSTELQGRVLDACVQLQGGYGYMAEYPKPARSSTPESRESTAEQVRS
ncbi:acyl-CoA dehydrogenase family protein [Amycolatopsis pithecellobii]|uniref:acyl-CoA dehydrogenase family protein n=1 Tax=Amycolatopsis pithecellobii TaxID=664692 RepID=UPI001FE8448D|nr:acyl-CoA dehydrogenase family protein [Amycolatopsis pithecellobii]